MQLGPVASDTYNVLKKNYSSIDLADTDYLSNVKEISENDVKIEFQNSNELSKSFKKALDFALREFGIYSWSEQSRISHYYPEWKKHEALIPEIKPRVPMDLRDFFDDPDDEAWLSDFGKDCDPFKEDKEFLALLRDDVNANTTPV